MEELLDILDENGQTTGEIRSSQEVHALGLLHRTAHVWFLNDRNELLLQKRSMSKIAYPGAWDISAAGHVSAGETSVTAILREVHEELGVQLVPDDLIHIGEIRENVELNGGTYIVREFQDVYLVRQGLDTEGLVLQEGEVEATRWIAFDDFVTEVEKEESSLAPHHEEHELLIAYIRTHDTN